jgi:non-heme chloroperoxidase
MRKVLLAILWCVGPVLGWPVEAAMTQSLVPGADGVRIHLLADGPENATRTLLLIPGWLTSARIWRAQIRFFAARGDRVIAMDPRSQGESSVICSHDDPESRARDIRQIIADLHLTGLVVVGWSQGVQDVAAYVDQFGGAGISKIVLVDATVSDGPAEVSVHPQLVKTVLRYMALYSHDPNAYSRGFMHAIISAPTAPPVMASLTAEFMKTPPAVGMAMQMEDLFTVDRRPYLKKFDRPTLVVVSDRNPFMAEEKQMADRLPNGRLVVIAHAAHAVFFDQPAAFNREVESFIVGEPGRGSHP